MARQWQSLGQAGGQSNGRRFSVDISGRKTPLTVSVDKDALVFENVEFEPGVVILTTNNTKYRLPMVEESGRILTSIDGYQFAFEEVGKNPTNPAAWQAGLEGVAEFVAELTSPMPGKVLNLMVEVGQKVNADCAIVVIEAMKMEHALRSTHPATVEKIHVKIGDIVAPGDSLVTLQAIEIETE